jgi:peptidoglycan/xylan/chitin deacetylase (PgdA/CDA1 family)
MDAWRAAARRGHELGNHSLFHQCSGKGAGREWVEPHRDLASTSARQMQDQVQLANTMLHAIDGRRERTYTAPCGDRLAGDTPYLPLIAPDFIAIKAGGAERVPASMTEIDPVAVPVFAPVDLSGPQLIALVKAAGERGTMVNFTFHGIGGDYLQVSKEAHAQLVQFLAKNRHLYWTDTFGRIMQHVKTERATSSTGPAR